MNDVLRMSESELYEAAKAIDGAVPVNLLASIDAAKEFCARNLPYVVRDVDTPRGSVGIPDFWHIEVGLCHSDMGGEHGGGVTLSYWYIGKTGMCEKWDMVHGGHTIALDIVRFVLMAIKIGADLDVESYKKSLIPVKQGGASD